MSLNSTATNAALSAVPKYKSLMESFERFERDGTQNLQRAEARTQGKAELILLLLTHRFGPIPSQVTQKIQSASEQELNSLAIKTIDIESVDNL